MERHSTGERAGLVVTNIGKLVGFAIAINEAFTQAAIRPGALMLAALLITGAQGLEAVLRSVFKP